MIGFPNEPKDVTVWNCEAFSYTPILCSSLRNQEEAVFSKLVSLGIEAKILCG